MCKWPNDQKLNHGRLAAGIANAAGMAVVKLNFMVIIIGLFSEGWDKPTSNVPVRLS